MQHRAGIDWCLGYAEDSDSGATGDD